METIFWDTIILIVSINLMLHTCNHEATIKKAIKQTIKAECLKEK
jgi:hypothetical protein